MTRTILLLAIAALTAAGCVAAAKPGTPELPPGMVALGVPEEEISGYVYIEVPSPVTVQFGGLTAPVTRMEAAFREVDTDRSGAVLLADADHVLVLEEASPDLEVERWNATVAMTNGLGAWADRIQDLWLDGPRVRIESHDPVMWRLLTLLPSDVPGDAVAAGYVHLAQNVSERVLRGGDISIYGLEHAFGLARVEELAFAVYAHSPTDIFGRFTPQVLHDWQAGAIVVAQSSYPGPVVDRVIGRAAGSLGLHDTTAAGVSAKYRALDGGLHLLMTNYGSTIFLMVAPSRQHAESLLQSVAASQTAR